MNWKKEKWEDGVVGMINAVSSIGEATLSDGTKVEMSYHNDGLHFDVQEKKTTYILEWSELLNELTQKLEEGE